ncbi:MAG: hypothetical protein HOM68_27815 [Gemmatimonadetes bacterium]|nr:hypothetical protein [Gemmatimonadota bacterium]MBT5591884.1 hypothetical protein [Gemmatimonadota bacterium]MBT5961559.1 hypothetical protein [Gemmatimonadota bacterium]MBT6630461.1 hypothetical protein [Gemmatimonadota bacterium]MBT7453753.1 hypothetical protein [Gemmatimonadota bacterium]
MRVYFPQELDLLLETQGFDIIHKWGDLERSNFGPDSHDQKVVCRVCN